MTAAVALVPWIVAQLACGGLQTTAAAPEETPLQVNGKLSQELMT